MKLLYTYKKSFKHKPPHSVVLLNEKDYRRFISIYRKSSRIERNYPEYGKQAFCLTGYGWIVPDGENSRETIFLRELSYNINKISLGD